MTRHPMTRPMQGAGSVHHVAFASLMAEHEAGGSG